MKKIKMVVADEDAFFLQQLTGYLVRTSQSFEVSAFGKRESLDRFVEEETADILLVTEGMRDTCTDACSAGVKCLMVEEDQEPPEGYHTVEKYQKTSALLAEVMALYSTKSGCGDALARGDRSTRVVGVYSPVGGSGKTTLALLLSRELGVSGKKVFYQNWEGLDSTCGMLPPEAKLSLSDVLVSVRGGEKGIGLRVVSGMCSSQEWGFSYINPRESSLELGEITPQEQMELLRQLADLGRFDVMVLDLDSTFSTERLELLTLCDWVITPFLPDAVSMNKLRQYFRESKLRGGLNGLLEKTLFVANRVGPEAMAALERGGVFQTFVPAATLPPSPVLADVSAALRSGGAATWMHGLADQVMR